MKQLADDGASMVWVLEMAQVLAQGGTISAFALEKVEDAQKAVEYKLWKVEVALGVSKHKLKKKVKELEKNIGEWGEEKKKLVEDRKSEWILVDDDPEDVKDLKTRAE